MRLLFLCDKPNPPGYIPRVRYLCNYLADKGNQITLITEKSDCNQLFSPKINIITFEYIKAKTSVGYKIEWLAKTALNLIYDHKGRTFFKKLSKKIKNISFDAVFCSSTFHSFPLTTAYMIAKRRQLPLYVDLRDIIEQTPQNSNNIFIHRLSGVVGSWLTKRFKYIHIKRRNEAIKRAKAVFTVSKWHTDFLNPHNPNTYTIYNGFDENLFVSQKAVSDTFDISYFGELTDNNLRYPIILLNALKNIVDKKKVDLNNIKVRWFTDKNSVKNIKKTVEEFGVQSIMMYEKFALGYDLVEKMNKSSILLIFSHNPDIVGYNGIMTTKFFEYIGVGRPILITPNNKDELSATAQNIKCGLVSSDIEEIESFILQKYSEWQIDHYVKNTTEAEQRVCFSRKKAADKVMEIVNI